MSPSVEHEALCALFKTADLPLLRALVAPVGIVLPDGAALRDASEESGQVIPTSFMADVVLKLDAGERTQVLIVEVQRGSDADKRWSWPVYFATIHALHRCGVVLLVVAPDANVAAWARLPISMGPHGTFCALVLGPGDMPLPEREGVEAPFVNSELVLRTLATVMHARGGEAMRHADLLGASLLVDERTGVQELCYRLLEGAFGYEFSARMEEHMAARNWIEDSPSLGKYYKQAITLGTERGLAEGTQRGLAEGKAEGRAEAKAEAIIAVFRARGLEVSELYSARIRACRDLKCLDVWLVKAVSATVVAVLWDE